MAEKTKQEKKKEAANDPALQKLIKALGAKDEVAQQALQNVAWEDPSTLKRILDYVATAGRKPTVESGTPQNGADGQFNRDTNKITLSDSRAQTLMHELTHVAQTVMENQAGKDPSGKSSQLLDKFKSPSFEALQKLMGTSGLGQDLAGNRDYSYYRLSPTETPAWGMGNMVNPKIWPENSSGHLDATMATEFQILLDLMSRQQKGMK